MAYMLLADTASIRYWTGWKGPFEFDKIQQDLVELLARPRRGSLLVVRVLVSNTTPSQINGGSKKELALESH